MLDRQLNTSGVAPIHFAGYPSRVTAATNILSKHPQTSVFYPRRWVSASIGSGGDLDIVLIVSQAGRALSDSDTSCPEDCCASHYAAWCGPEAAFVITHADRASDSQLQQIEKTIRAHNSSVPIYRARHAIAGLRSTNGSSVDLRDQSIFAFCGIANPRLFEREIQATGAKIVGHRSFADHHRYTASTI